MLPGPEGERDALGKWLLSSTTLLARPHVIYNHLVIFNKLDEVMQIPVKYRHAVPSINGIAAAIGKPGTLGKTLVQNARMAAAKLDVEV